MTAREKLVLFASNMLPLMPHTFDRFVSLLDAALAEAREGQMGDGTEDEGNGDQYTCRACGAVDTGPHVALCVRCVQPFCEQCMDAHKTGCDSVVDGKEAEGSGTG